MLMARLGSVCTISRAQRSRRSESSGAVALNSSASRPCTAAASGLNASAGASTMKKWMPRASSACSTAGATSSADFTVMRSSAKSVLSTRAERLRLVDADLRAGERMLAALQDQALIGRDRLVARIALDLDVADGDARLQRRRLRKRGRGRMRQQDSADDRKQ